MQANRKWLIGGLVCLTMVGCGKHEMSEQEHKEANSPAGKVGQVAYEAAKGSGKVAKVAGKEISKAAHDVHEGWKEAAEKDKAKH